MLIYSETRLVPTDVDMLVIADKDGAGYYYIHRALYDQAVIINDMYNGKIDELVKELSKDGNSREDVEYFFENAPRPINMLAPFLLLVNDMVESYEDMVGAIHVMSGPLHFRRMLSIPKAMRNDTPTFSLSIKEEYQLAWSRFFMHALPYNDSMYTAVGTPMNGSMTSNVVTPTTSYAAPAEAEEPELSLEEQMLAAFGDDAFDDLEIEIANSLGAGDDTEEEEETAAAVTPEPAPAPAPAPTPVSGVDAILSL